MSAVMQEKKPDSPPRVTELRDSAAPAPKTLRQRLRLPLMVGVPVLVLLGALYYYILGGREQSTDDAYVRAAQVTISSNVSGRVSEIDVHDNEQVRTGQTLFRIDERPFRIAVEEAQARLDAARLQIASLKATYHRQVADLRAAESASISAARHDRQSRLLASPASPRRSKSITHSWSRKTAQQRVAARSSRSPSRSRTSAAIPMSHPEQHPLVQQAQASWTARS